MFVAVVPVALFVALFLAARILVRRGVLTTHRTARWRNVGSAGAMILICFGLLLAVSNTIWFHSDGLTLAAAACSVLAATWTMYWLTRR